MGTPCAPHDSGWVVPCLGRARVRAHELQAVTVQALLCPLASTKHPYPRKHLDDAHSLQLKTNGLLPECAASTGEYCLLLDQRRLGEQLYLNVLLRGDPSECRLCRFASLSVSVC